MIKETASIHDFDFALICDYDSRLERQGPGSPEAIPKALSFSATRALRIASNR